MSQSSTLVIIPWLLFPKISSEDTQPKFKELFIYFSHCFHSSFVVFFSFHFDSFFSFFFSFWFLKKEVNEKERRNNSWFNFTFLSFVFSFFPFPVNWISQSCILKKNQTNNNNPILIRNSREITCKFLLPSHSYWPADCRWLLSLH